MRFITNRLFCCELVVLASFNIASNIEARLPKHMAEKATELLIEKSKLQLDETKTDSFVKNLAGFLYSTEKRQHFADWMKAAYKATRGNSYSRCNDSINFSNSYPKSICTELYGDLCLSDIKGWNDDNWKSRDFIAFVNSLFPCWTGTLTCFMLHRNNKAFEALCSTEGIAQKCQDILLDADNTHKVMGILFTLELVDDWKYIQQICKQANDNDNSKLEEPSLAEPYYYDPYNCVPVPNTAYLLEGRKFQGSCMISTIRNLLCIFCRKNKDATQCEVNNNLKNELRQYLQRIGGNGLNKIDLYSVPGTTNPNTLKEFAELVFSKQLIKLYEPAISLFICALNELLQETFNISATCDFLLANNVNQLGKSIEDILKKIAGHELKATLSEKVLGQGAKYELEIIDSIVNKKINIGMGKCGSGEHIEIMKIADIQ